MASCDPNELSYTDDKDCGDFVLCFRELLLSTSEVDHETLVFGPPLETCSDLMVLANAVVTVQVVTEDVTAAETTTVDEVECMDDVLAEV
jgi:hypothetical protein